MQNTIGADVLNQPEKQKTSSLKPEMQAELHLPHRNLRVGDLSRPALVDVVSRKPEIYMIEHVECVRPQLKRSALTGQQVF